MAESTSSGESETEATRELLDTAEARIDDLRAARERREAVEAEIDDAGEDAVVAAADTYRKAVRLLDRYEDSATGTGDFQAYVEFQDKFLGLLEELSDDVPAQDAFEAAAERMDRRRLSEDDFEGARADLEPAADYVDLLDRREAAEEAVSKARRDARLCLRDLDEEIERREETLAFADADLDAPVEELREPIRAYNDAVTEEFDEFYESAAAADVVGLLERAESFPLVEFRSPPRDLREFARESPDADEPIPTLLEYADYSGSKLDHYAEDPALLQTTVAVHRTFLERLSAEPLTVELPPPAAESLRLWAREATSVLGRFASEETVARLRGVRDLTRRDDYEDLRFVARAHEELDAEARERVNSGAAAAELDRLRDARERLESTLHGEAEPGDEPRV
ncbi:DUF7118 family protein [Halobellus limi]|jgi:hypothetical protein|uniref:Uncharacterized protein n=1 Tax=Halobellus limi TaxID=699433 RepID=A0A1H5WQ00_9EURY|nr:hypothetical protein [Halobellus limi]SEG01438.1 hypothetical protein SAMN04488133_1354 [Halobellus limi]